MPPFLESCKYFIVHLQREFIAKGCQKSAAALTYMTLFALVPLLAVFYAMFSLFPAFDGLDEELQGVIFSHLLPESGSDLQGYIQGFSSQARNLSAPGAVLLIVTAYLMLTNIEKTFNNIWGVKSARKGVSSFLLYWAVLSIGPLLLGSGLAVSTYFLSLKLFVSEYDALGVSELFFSVFPWFLASIAFTLLFAAVPNCKVPIRFALIGGVTSALCFQLLKVGFAWVVSNSSFSSIYGAFAVVPLFLLWINCVWVIVLGGAVLVRTLTERGYRDPAARQSDMLSVLQVLQVFREKSLSGEAVKDEDCVNRQIGLVHWQQLRSLLAEQNWIAVTENGDYVLSRDLSRATLLDVAHLVNMPLNQLKGDVDHPADWVEEVNARRKAVRDTALNSLALSLSDLYTKPSEVR